MSPRTDESRQRADPADRLSAAGVALERNTQADHRWLRRRKLACELLDIGGFDARNLLDIFGRELCRAGFQLSEAVSVLIDIVLIDETLGDDRVDEAYRQSAVGAGPRADTPIASLRRTRSVAVDHHHLGAALLCLKHKGPVMQIGRDRVAGPNHDELGMDETFRIDAAGRTHRQ